MLDQIIGILQPINTKVDHQGHVCSCKQPDFNFTFSFPWPVMTCRALFAKIKYLKEHTDLKQNIIHGRFQYLPNLVQYYESITFHFLQKLTVLLYMDKLRTFKQQENMIERASSTTSSKLFSFSVKYRTKCLLKHDITVMGLIPTVWPDSCSRNRIPYCLNNSKSAVKCWLICSTCDG